MSDSTVRPDLALGRVYAMRAADAMASALAAYGVPLLVLLTTGSTGLTGLAFAVQWAPRLAAFGFAGALADRYGPSPVFRTANMVRAMFVSLVATVLLSAEGETAALVVVMVFGAISGLLAEVSFVAAETVGSNAARRSEGRAHQVQAALTGIDQGAALVGALLGASPSSPGPPCFCSGWQRSLLSPPASPESSRRLPAPPPLPRASSAGGARCGRSRHWSGLWVDSPSPTSSSGWWRPASQSW